LLHDKGLLVYILCDKETVLLSHRSFQNAAENDLHPIGKGAVLRSKLCGKGNGMKFVKTEFYNPGFYGYILIAPFIATF
jgi:hypothetical protein